MRLVHIVGCLGFLAKVHRLPDTNEWRVSTFEVGTAIVRGKLAMVATGTSFHDDKADAIGTAEHELMRYAAKARKRGEQ